jgi:ATP-dependent 26S proteasome regulatory subunit
MRGHQDINQTGMYEWHDAAVERCNYLLITHICCSDMSVLNFPSLQTIFLPLIGLVDPATLKPGDLIGVNKDSFLVLDTLPTE